MASRKITTVFDAENRGLKTAVVEGTTSIQNLRKAADREARSIARSWGNMAQSVGRSLQRVAAVGAVAFAAASKVSADFGKQMANVNSIALQSEKDFQRTARAVLGLNVAIGTAQAPKTLAAALYDINSAGFVAKDGLEVLKSAAIGADAGATTAAIAADGLTTELRAFGLQAADSSKVLDVMLKTVQRGKITFEQLSSGIGSVASDSVQAGVSMEELHGSIALLTAKTGQAKQSLTRIQQLMIKLSAPTKEAREQYDALGLSYGEAAIQQRGFIGQLQAIQAATGGDKIAFRELLGGSSEAASAAFGLLGDDKGAAALGEIAEVSNSAGTAMTAFGEQAKSAAFQWERLLSTISAGAVLVGNTMAPALEWLTGKIQILADKFVELDPKIQKFVTIGAAVGTALAGIAGVALTVAPAVASVVVALQSAAGTAFVAWVGSAAAALGAFVTGPLAAAAVAVGALYVVWTKNFGGIRDKVSEWASQTSDAVSEVSDYFADKFHEMSRVAVDAWGLIKPFAIAAMGEIQARLKVLGEFISGVASIAWELFSGAAEVAWENITGAVEIGTAAITAVVRTTSALMSGDWRLALGHMWLGVKNVGGKIIQGFKNIFREIVEWIKSLGGAFYDAGKGVGESLLEGITGSLDRWKSAFSDAADHAKREMASVGPILSGHEFDGLFEGVRQLGVRATTVEYGPPVLAPAPGPAPPPNKAVKTKGKSDAELISEIRKGADVKGNVSFAGAKRELIEAVAKFVENAARDGLRPVISSVTDGKHAPNSYHYAGEAMDFGYYRPDGGTFDPGTEAALGKKHLKGTGFKGMLDELLGGSPHLHAALGLGDSGDSRFVLIEDGFKSVEEEQKKTAERFKSFAQAHQEETIKQTDALLDLFGESTSLFEGLGKMVQDSAVATQAASSLALAGASAPASGLGGAFGTPEQIAAADAAAVERTQQAEEQKYQARLRRHQAELQLGYMEQEQFVMWLQQQAEAEGLSTEQRYQRELAYHEQKRLLEEETAIFTGQFQQQLTGQFQSFLQGTLSGQQTFAKGFQSLWQSIMQTVIQKIIQAIIKATILQKILSSIGGFFGGIFGLGGGLVSGAGAGLNAGAMIGANHSGGLIGPDSFSRGLQGSGSLGTNEVLRKLEIGEGVIDKKTMRDGFGGGGLGGGITIHHHGDLNNGLDVEAASGAIAWGIQARLVGA